MCLACNNINETGSIKATLGWKKDPSTGYFYINTNGQPTPEIMVANGAVATADNISTTGQLSAAAIATSGELSAASIKVNTSNIASYESMISLGGFPGQPNEGGELQLNKPLDGGRTAYIDNYESSNTNSYLRFLSGAGDTRSDSWLASLDLNTGDFSTVGKLIGSSISTTGQVSAGSISTTGTFSAASLSTPGQVAAGSIKVNNWTITAPDYVFEPEYKAQSLKETERYVRTNKHLPEIPSAAEMKAGGMDLAEMNLRLLKKVEELTLHAIDQEKRIDDLEKRVGAH